MADELDAQLKNPRQARQLIKSLRGAAQRARHGALLDRALQLWPNNLHLKLDKAQACVEAQDFNEAATHLVEAMWAHPRALAPVLQLANLAQFRNWPNEAIGHLTTAVRLRPDSPMILRRLARMLYSEKRYSEAEPHYLRLLQLTPNDHNASIDLAHLYASTGRRDEAERITSELLAWVPNHIDAAADLAQWLVMDGRNAEAEQLLRDAIARKPVVLFHRALALLLTDLGRFDEAEPMLRHVLEHEPDNPHTLLRLARICAATKREEEAKFLAVKSLDPTRLQAADLIKTLIVPSLADAVTAELAKRASGAAAKHPAASLLDGMLFPQSAAAPKADESSDRPRPIVVH